MKRNWIKYVVIGFLALIGLMLVANAEQELFSYRYYGSFQGTVNNNIFIIDGILKLEDTKPFNFKGVGMLKQVDSAGLHTDCINANAFSSSIILDNGDKLGLFIKGKLCDAGNDWQTYRGTYKIVTSNVKFTKDIKGNGVISMTVNPDGKIVDGRLNGILLGY